MFFASLRFSAQLGLAFYRPDTLISPAWRSRFLRSRTKLSRYHRHCIHGFAEHLSERMYCVALFDVYGLFPWRKTTEKGKNRKQARKKESKKEWKWNYKIKTKIETKRQWSNRTAPKPKLKTGKVVHKYIPKKLARSTTYIIYTLSFLSDFVLLIFNFKKKVLINLFLNSEKRNKLLRVPRSFAQRGPWFQQPKPELPSSRRAKPPECVQVQTSIDRSSQRRPRSRARHRGGAKLVAVRLNSV